MENLLPRHRIGAAVGDRGGHDGELFGGDAQRALARVEVERHVGIVVDAVVVLQQPCDGAVVEVGFALRTVEFVEYRHLAAAKSRNEIHDRLPLGLRVARRFDHRAG